MLAASAEGNPAIAELQRAHQALIETEVSFSRNVDDLPQLPLEELRRLYQRAVLELEKNSPESPLIAERWARTVRHLALAFWQEAQIQYLERHGSALPRRVSGAITVITELQSTRESAQSLLDAAEHRLSSEPKSIQLLDAKPLLESLLSRGKSLLERPVSPLSFNASIRAAHEYGRTLEYAYLALEAERARDGASSTLEPQPGQGLKPPLKKPA
ncbi:MAG: hypothetical protein RJB38_970 [Pseudomonadota bacterium]|jgi:hypothetical protein